MLRAAAVHVGRTTKYPNLDINTFEILFYCMLQDVVQFAPFMRTALSNALRLLLLVAAAAAQPPPGDDPATKEADRSMQIDGMKTNLPQYAVSLLTVPVALGMAAGAKAYVNATKYGEEPISKAYIGAFGGAAEAAMLVGAGYDAARNVGEATAQATADGLQGMHLKLEQTNTTTLEEFELLSREEYERASNAAEANAAKDCSDPADGQEPPTTLPWESFDKTWKVMDTMEPRSSELQLFKLSVAKLLAIACLKATLNKLEGKVPPPPSPPAPPGPPPLPPAMPPPFWKRWWERINPWGAGVAGGLLVLVPLGLVGALRSHRRRHSSRCSVGPKSHARSSMVMSN